MTSDEALMLEFQGGSRAAFEELFARYRKPLYGFFGRRLNNPERAEDLVQETFLAVIRAASRYEPRALVRTYLYGIALNLLAAERRKFSTSSTSGQSAPEPKTGRNSRVRALGPASHGKAGFAGPRNFDAARIRTTELLRHCGAVANSRKYGPVQAFSIASCIEELPGVAAKVILA